MAVFAGGELRGKKSSLPSAVTFSLPAPEPFTVKYQIASMTLREKIGQMFLVSFAGTELTEEMVLWMRELKIGGVVLLGDNVVSKEQTKKLINALQKEVGSHVAAPLFIAVDQEGGEISRFKFSGYEMRSEREVTNAALAYDIALSRGKELRELGVTMNFSPVLDVSSSTKDFIHDRTFEGDAGTVALYGKRMIEGYRDGGVASVAKHFPGHGDTPIDSHVTLPVTVRTAESWKMHLAPFESAIQAGVPVIMSAHLKVPFIDKKFPASLSNVILTDVLRNGLGFKGVIVSDDLGMGALTKNYAFSEIAVQAVAAGTDILLIIHSPATYQKMFLAIEDAVERGIVSEDRIDESVTRILSLKHNLTK